MNRLKRAMLIGAAIAVLGAAYAGACRRDHNTTPVEPTHIASPTATPTLDDRVTVTPENTPVPENTSTATPTKTPATPTPTATPTPKSTYELALERLDYQTAQHWKGVARSVNSEHAINELVFLPQEGRLVLAGDVKAYAADGNISDKELSDLADPDRDGIKSSQEAKNGTNPMDPSNTLQKVSPATFSFVRNLVKYNDSQNNGKPLPQIYSGLERVIYVVEQHPKIVNGLNPFGNDALALLLTDNQGIVDMDKYWFLTNATALQAQDFFYVGNEIMWDGRFKDQIKGPATDRKFDEKEREIANFRLRKQIEWEGKWSTPLEYEAAVQDYGSEQRASNALRWRVLPQRLFVDDIVNGGTHPSYSSFDSNAWLVVASYNNENSEAVRKEILERLNDPERYARDERILKDNVGAALPNVDVINRKALKYFNIIFSQGTPYEKAALLITEYAEEAAPHDLATPLFALWSTLVGSSGGVGSARIIHPEGYETGDSQFMFTLSKITEQKLKGVFVYGIDDLARLLFLSEEEKKDPKYSAVDGLFGVYSNIEALRQNGAKYLSVLTPGWRVIEIPIPK